MIQNPEILEFNLVNNLEPGKTTTMSLINNEQKCYRTIIYSLMPISGGSLLPLPSQASMQLQTCGLYVNTLCNDQASHSVSHITMDGKLMSALLAIPIS